MLPSAFETESAPGNSDFVARWLACAPPYRRFVDVLTNANARLGADADRYSFTVVDLHLLLFAGFDRRTRSQRIFTKTIGSERARRATSAALH